jgi:rod shape-determining protein MreD
MNKQFKNITNLLIIFFLGVIQITLMPYFDIMGLWPNLIFLLAITFILIGAEQEAYLTASFGGLILDFVSPIFFGFNVLILVTLVALTQLLTKKFLSEVDVLMAGLVYIVATFIFNLIFSLIGHQFGWPALFIDIIYSLIVGSVMFYIVNNWFDRREF